MSQNLMTRNANIMCDRKKLKRQAVYFWLHAGLGSASGSLVFFFELDVSLKHSASRVGSI